MRTGVDAPTLALHNSASRDIHARVRVANGSGTLKDLSARCVSVSWTPPNASQSVGTLDVTLARETTDVDASSYSPFVEGSAQNTLDDGVTYSPLLLTGRLITLEIAYTAEKAARPADGSALWYEVHRGLIANVEWPGEFGGTVQVHARDQAGKLQTEKAEAAHTYASGTAIETTAQAALDDRYGAGVYTLSVPAATSQVLSANYAPSAQKRVWEILQDLAASIGWLCWYRYTSATASAPTLFEPPRTKAVADATVPAVYGFDAIGFAEEEIANVLYGQYVDSGGELQDAGPVEDATSITRYGAVRRAAWIVLGEDSPVRSSAGMTALLTAALSDMADPDALVTATVPLFAFTEPGVDLLAFSDPQGVRFDTAQNWAPYSVTHTIAADERPKSVMQLRGKPSAGFRTWDARRSTTTAPTASLEIHEIKEIARTATTVTKRLRCGSGVASVWYHLIDAVQPVAADPWPDTTTFPTDVLTPTAGVVDVTLTLPVPGHVAYVQFEPRAADPAVCGPVRRMILYPPNEDPDKIYSLGVLVDDTDGSAAVTAYVGDRVQSVRFAYAMGDPATDPADATVEAALVRTITGSATWPLAAGTVAYNQGIKVRACAYLNADGTGSEGATDHGPIVGAEDRRERPVCALEPGTQTKTSSTATSRVTVKDPGGYATLLEARVTVDGAAPGAWTSISASPTDNTEYSHTAALAEKHQVYIDWRLTGSKNGAAFSVPWTSPGFDFGKTPNIQIIPQLDEDAATGSCAVIADVDTVASKLLARTDRPPTTTEVRAATPITGRMLSPADVGALATGLVPGVLVYYGGLGIGPAGEESSALATAVAVFGTIAPQLKPYSASESGTTATFGVTVADPGGQATLLQYQKRDAGAAWPGSWTTKANPPAHNTAYEETATMSKGHPCQLRFLLTYTLNGQTMQVPATSPVFDVGAAPDVTSILVTFDASNHPIVSCIGDYDVRSNGADASFVVKCASGSSPADPTLLSNDGTILYRQGSVTLSGVTVAAGAIAYVKVAGVSAAGALGTVKEVQQKNGVAATTTPQFTSISAANASNDGAGHWNATASWAGTGTGADHVDIAYWFAQTGVEELSAYSTSTGLSVSSSATFDSGIAPSKPGVIYHLYFIATLKNSGGTVLATAQSNTLYPELTGA